MVMVNVSLLVSVLVQVVPEMVCEPVTIMIATMSALVVLVIAVNEGMAPEPLFAGMPTEAPVFVQLKVVLAPVFALNEMAATDLPEHACISVTGFTTGSGLTVITTVCGLPEHGPGGIPVAIGPVGVTE